MIDDPTTTPVGRRVVLAHDWLCGRRGGEAVLERIAAVLRERHEVVAVLTMFDDGSSIGPAVDALPRIVWPGGRVPGAQRLRRWMLPLYPEAVRWLSGRLARLHDERPINLVVSSSSAAIKGLRPPRSVPHVCYCHAPARYVWSVEDEYAVGRSPGDALRTLGLRAVGPLYRAWDRRTAANVTRFVANSSHTADEIARCYGREATVVPPPVRTGFFTPDPGVPREPFWLFAGALEPYKRADLAIEAARWAGVRLVVVGGGSMVRSLRTTARRLPDGAVEFAGRVSDERLRDLYRRARLLLFPQVEDFGITAVEAQACGCPVVARRAGGALDTVIEARTGAFFDRPEPAAIAEAAGRCPIGAETVCRQNADRFNEDTFDTSLAGEIDKLPAR
ncbi:MAG: glycosyltransferase [Phycisphaeraceae bacterium]|nr:glycosyltransferase [Phycisphaeraceae bacterium]